MKIVKTLFIKFFYRSSIISRIRKCIPGKMMCGLAFQHLPESIHMVKRYEIITEKCSAEIAKLVRTAKWRYKRK
ncbi:MAG: hypothetical protein KZQ83_00645 [gamma proteobacterium symbiont of Taylorina sp.]|nr:hypothetical protein [gamma proteobacterium symbiont of Taylorina sp.]